MSYTFDHLKIDHLKKFTPICAEDIARHASPDVQLLFNDENIDENIFKINHYLATLHLEGKEKDALEYPIIESILKKPLPNPVEQVDILIRLLSKFGHAISFIGNDKFEYYTGSQHPDMFDVLVEHLQYRKWIKGRQNYVHGDRTYNNFMLTIQGWERFTQLQKGEISYNKGFMAMQFDNKPLQKILEDNFKPAMKRIGLELTKLDDISKLGLLDNIPKPGLIDNHMLVEIQTSDFIVADLSDENRGVYFESGYAMGLGKTVIYTCEEIIWKKKEVHFDINHYQIILWNKESPEVAAGNLVAAVRAGFPGKIKIPDDG